MREMDTKYPSSETVFDYLVDTKTRQWSLWESKLSATFKPPADLPFFKIMVPTVDTLRTKFVAQALVKVVHPHRRSTPICLPHTLTSIP
jgi:dynein heavy chain